MSLNRRDPPTLGDIAQLPAMDRTTLTAHLKPLARRGLVRVALDAADRRIRRPALTPPVSSCWPRRCRYGTPRIPRSRPQRGNMGSA
jgi:hypothetical protein